MGEGRFLCSVGLGIEGEVVDYYFIVGYRQSLCRECGFFHRRLLSPAD